MATFLTVVNSKRLKRYIFMSLYISLTDKQIHVFTVFSFLIFIMLGLNVLYIHFAQSWCCQLITNLLQVLSEANTYCTNTQLGYWYFYIYCISYLLIILLLFIIIYYCFTILNTLHMYGFYSKLFNESIKQNNDMYKTYYKLYTPLSLWYL